MRDRALPVRERALLVCSRPERARSAEGASLKDAHSAEPGLSARGATQSQLRMSLVLPANVPDRSSQIASPQRPKIVTVGPAESRSGHDAVPIRDPRTRALQALDQTGNIDAGRQLQDQMQVVPNDSHLDDSSAVPASDLRQGATQERGGARVDERQPTKGRPRQERIQADGHRLRCVGLGDLT